MKITILERKADGDCSVLWNTQRATGHQLVLNVYQGHFNWVKRVNTFVNAFVCSVCSRRYSRQNALSQHKCSTAEERRRSFPGGVFEPHPTVFDKLSKFARLSVSKVCYPYRIAFDIEVVLKKEDLPLQDAVHSATLPAQCVVLFKYCWPHYTGMPSQIAWKRKLGGGEVGWQVC